KPKGDITLKVLDAKGGVVTTLSSKPEPEEKDDEGEYPTEKYKKTVLPTEAGLHRVVWDLRYEGAEVIKGAKVDSGEPRRGPLVSPGTYTLELTVAGETLRANVEVRHDMRTVPGSVLTKWKELAGAARATEFEEFLRQNKPFPFTVALDEELKLALRIRDDISRLAGTVEQLRSVRGQLLARNELLKEDAKAKPLVQASKDLLPKLDELEGKLHNPKARVSYDILAQKGGAKLYSQLVWLFELIKDSDGAPTQGLREVYAEQSRLLGEYVGEWQALRTGELGKLNELARKLELPGVIVPAGAK